MLVKGSSKIKTNTQERMFRHMPRKGSAKERPKL